MTGTTVISPELAMVTLLNLLNCQRSMGDSNQQSVSHAKGINILF